MCDLRREPLSRRLLLALPAGAALSAAAPPGWRDGDFIEAKVLAARVGEAKSGKLLILHVGFNVLYRNRRIPHSLFAGPGATPEGLAALRQAVAGKPKTTEIVIYCGCCPWSHCPNMKPAFEALRALGFTRVKALQIETNFSQDWIQLGYPVESGQPGR